MHTTACPRRFWSAFNFSSKGESRSNEKKCSDSKDIVSPPLFLNADLDDVSKSLSANTTATFSPSYSTECQFDLKSTPMNCLRIRKPLKEESLISLLDGHPVPKMLKWKLKGYKTLRNKQAIDFAFVPGEKSHDLDILPRNESQRAADNLDDTVQRQESLATGKKTENNDKKDTLRLMTKAIENKAETEAKDIDKIVENNDGSKDESERNVSDQKLLLNSSVRKEDVKYLPILKSELKYQTQPVARFSSRPPKKLRKPSAPIFKRTDYKRPDSEKEIPDEEKNVLEFEEEREASLAKPSIPKFSELAENSTERSSVESQRNEEHPIEHEMKTEETKSDAKDCKNDCNNFEYETSSASAEMSPQDEPKAVETTRSRNASSTESPAEDLGKVADEKRFERPRSSAYFAPRAPKQKPRLSTSEGVTLESIIGIPERTTPRLNITKPDEARAASSPCAATRVRLRTRQNGIGRASSSRINSFGNGKSQSMPGNSDGGSRKPPTSFPPVTGKRSSSNSSCLLGKATASKGASSAPNRVLNSKNSSLNISTASANPAKKCRDDYPKARRKNCEQERPCKRDRKICKRYCCPELQTPTKCDYSRFQCPNDKCAQSIQPEKVKRDPTCLPNDESKEDQGREFCTTPREPEDCNRSCRREERSRQCSERCIMSDFDYLVKTKSDTLIFSFF